MESVYCDENIEIFVGDKYPAEETSSQQNTCSCGRTVCCGKHKACCSGKSEKKKLKIRFIKEKTL